MVFSFLIRSEIRAYYFYCYYGLRIMDRTLSIYEIAPRKIAPIQAAAAINPRHLQTYQLYSDEKKILRE